RTPGTYTKDITSWRMNKIPFGKRISLTHTIAESDLNGSSGEYTYFSFRLRNERKETTIRFKEVKLEKGNKATDWTPAPEDTDAKITNNTTLIEQNADSLKLKANQDTVDTLAGTVQSLGTEFDVVAGQVSSRVWNTDIESAIDGLEIGGRNLALGTTKEFNTVRVAKYSGSLTDSGVTSKYIYTLDELGVKAGDTLTVSMYVGESVEGYGGGFRIDDQGGQNKYSTHKVVKNGY